MRHQSKNVIPFIALLALVGLGTSARAQQQTVTLSQAGYDSLTNVAGNVSGTQNVTGNTDFVRGNGLARAPKSNNEGAFAFRYGADATSRGTVSDLGNGTLSTTLVTDDLTLQVAKPFDGASLSSFSLTSTRFLLTNENDTDINVTAHVRFYEDDGSRNVTVNGGTRVDGGFAGTLLAQYDLNTSTLLGRGTNFASATQIELTAADFAATPLTFSSGSFSLNALSQYENRIWVGVFLTANSATTTVSQLSNVGLTVYDNDLSNNGGATNFAVGRSDNQFYGDNNTNAGNGLEAFDGARENSPYNYNLKDANGFTYFNGNNNQPNINPNVNGTNPTNTFGLIRAGLLDGDATASGPDANLTWLIQGNATYVIPEPGTAGFVLASGLPLIGVVVTRRRRAGRAVK